MENKRWAIKWKGLFLNRVPQEDARENVAAKYFNVTYSKNKVP